MSNPTPHLAQAVVPASCRVARRRNERGMATIEYAIGVVMVIVLIGVIIFAIQSDTFSQLVDGFLRALVEYAEKAFAINPFKP